LVRTRFQITVIRSPLSARRQIFSANCRL
jgi:hypothetical protein